MCGRYTLHVSDETFQEVFGLFAGAFRIEARYNIAPGQWVVVIRPDGKGGSAPARLPDLARWGLVPSWSRDPASGPRPINARSETAAQSPLFRGPLRHGRCLVPASGFYEWQRKDGARLPWLARPAEDPLFAFAGIWEVCQGLPDGRGTCAILTTTPNEAMAPIHDRMPVILPRSAWEAWLDPATDPETVQSLLRPCPAEVLRLHRVSPAVGDARREGPELAEAWEEQEQGGLFS